MPLLLSPINLKTYKISDGEVSKPLQQPVMDKSASIDAASQNLGFSAAVAQSGMLLRNSTYKANSGYALTEQPAARAAGNDPGGYRKEFLELVQKARKLSKEVAVNDE